MSQEILKLGNKMRVIPMHDDKEAEKYNNQRAYVERFLRDRGVTEVYEQHTWFVSMEDLLALLDDFHVNYL